MTRSVDRPLLRSPEVDDLQVVHVVLHVEQLQVLAGRRIRCSSPWHRGLGHHIVQGPAPRQLQASRPVYLAGLKVGKGEAVVGCCGCFAAP